MSTVMCSGKDVGFPSKLFSFLPNMCFPFLYGCFALKLLKLSCSVTSKLDVSTNSQPIIYISSKINLKFHLLG